MSCGGATRLIGLGLLLVSSRALANGLSLEGALTYAPNFPSGSGSDQVYLEGGAFGHVTYEFDDWGVGVRGQGAFSLETPLNLTAGGLTLTGSLYRRQYGIGAFTRRFFHDHEDRKRWYIEFAFYAMQTDFIHSERVYTIPQSPGYTRIFIQGGAFAIGLGYRPKKGPWFYQLNYRLEHYDTLLITGEVNYLHPIFINAPLSPVYFVHSIVFAVGLDVFGR